MAKALKYNCDECGAERKEANHWFVVFLNSTKESIEVFKWGRFQDEDGAIHICGRECLQKRVEKFAEPDNTLTPSGKTAGELMRKVTA